MIAIGVDTHKDEHTAVAVDQLGQIHDQIEVEATTEGYARLLEWANEFNAELKFGIESTGSYGAGLCRYLRDQDQVVYEVEAPRRKSRRRGKSDVEDALLAAKSLLSGEHLSIPRSSGVREELRMVLLAHEACAKERTRLINQLHALVVVAPASLRERIGQLKGNGIEQRLIGMRKTSTMSDVEATALAVMRDFAKRSHDLDKQKDAYRERIAEFVVRLNEALLDESGVGPIAAAKLLLSSPERFKSEGAFARANGTAPIPASSGKTQRHRLNRGGDRQVNHAIHIVALNRAQHHSESRAYLDRKIGEGKTKREAMRALKRNLSKRLFKILQPVPLTT